MKAGHVVAAWGRILRGRRPLLSLEITRECPLRCPGCYAYEPEHLHDAGPLRQLADFQGHSLISGVLALARRFRPIHISIVWRGELAPGVGRANGGLSEAQSGRSSGLEI